MKWWLLTSHYFWLFTTLSCYSLDERRVCLYHMSRLRHSCSFCVNGGQYPIKTMFLTIVSGQKYIWLIRGNVFLDHTCFITYSYVHLNKVCSFHNSCTCVLDLNHPADGLWFVPPCVYVAFLQFPHKLQKCRTAEPPICKSLQVCCICMCWPGQGVFWIMNWDMLQSLTTLIHEFWKKTTKWDIGQYIFYTFNEHCWLLV